MSLDVYLRMPEPQAMPAREAIFIREGGATREISRSEWDLRYPGREPVVMAIGGGDDDILEVYSANITHNLGKMASEAGLYESLWRPEEIGISIAAQLVEPLSRGLELLKSDPSRFKAYNPANGWGSYTALVEFVEKYLAACRDYPTAIVSACR